jgi:hypothetical protein
MVLSSCGITQWGTGGTPPGVQKAPGARGGHEEANTHLFPTG